MMMVNHALILLVVLVSPLPVSSQTSEPPNTKEYHVPEGGSQALNCSLLGAPDVSGWRNVTWILPDLTLIQRAHAHEFQMETSFTLSEDGEILLVENLQTGWYGEYYCVVLHEPQNFFVSRFGLNTSYFYAAELWSEYRRILIILGVASGCFLALLSLLFGLVLCWKKSCCESRIEGRSNAISERSSNTLSIWEEYMNTDIFSIDKEHL